MPRRRQLFEERAQATGVAPSKRQKTHRSGVVVEEIIDAPSEGEIDGVAEGAESPDGDDNDDNDDNDDEIVFGHPAAAVSTAIPYIFAARAAIPVQTALFFACLY